MAEKGVSLSNSSKPMVSILIAAFESDPIYLRAAIESALNQTWTNIEVVVSDDSSTNQLNQLAASFCDARLTYHHNSSRLGVARNYNRCLEVSSGEFIVVLNHDDAIESNFLDTLVPHLQENPEVSLAFCDHWVIDGNGNKMITETEETSLRFRRSELRAGVCRPFRDLVVRQSIPMAMGTVFRRSRLSKTIPQEVGPSYDLWLAFELAKSAAAAFYEPTRLSNWRVHQSNLSNTGNVDWALGAAACWSVMLKDDDYKNHRQVIVTNWAKSLASAAIMASKKGMRRHAFQLALKSLQTKFTKRGVKSFFWAIFSKKSSN